NSAAGGNFLDKMPADCLKIIESKSKVHQTQAKAVVAKVSLNSSIPAVSADVAELKDMVRALLLDKKNQYSAQTSSPTPAPIKAVELNCVACGGNHAYQNCPATSGNVYQDNIQEYVSQAVAANYGQGNTGFHPQMVTNQIRPPGFPPVQNTQNNFNRGNNFNQNRGSGTLLGNTVTNHKEDLKGITTRSGVAYQGPTIPTPFKVAKQETEVTKDQVQTLSSQSTTPIQPTVTQSETENPVSEPVVAPVKSVNLINIFNLSSEDCLKDLVSHKQSGNPTFSLHKEIASSEVIPEFHDSKGCSFLSEELPDIDSFNDIHPYFDDDPLSGSTTYSANTLLEEFADELALILYPPDYDDYRACDIESDIREIEFLLFQGEGFDFKDSIDQSVLTHFDDLFVDLTPEMFVDEQPPDYLFPPRFDVYPDDFLEIESDAKFDDDSFDSEGEKIKETELLIDLLDLPCDILSEYDSFNSQDFSRDDVLFSPDNEDNVFNPGILSHEKSVKIITRVTQEKKLVVSYASWLFEDFDHPFSELLVFKEVPISMRFLPFSSENEEKVFKPGIYNFKKFHCCFLSELSHP
nr:reverse transcriptase domain-containing protein [Tanacetum cinerariifolium]